jgi:RNA polymerase sigma-70 factor, ECF subfamily
MPKTERGTQSLLPTRLLGRPHRNDQALWRGIEKGRRTGLSELYDRYGVDLYGLAVRLLGGDLLSAEDVVADAFLDLWRDPNAFAPGGRAVRSRLVGAIAVGALRVRSHGRD